MCLILEPHKKQTSEILSNSFIKFILLMTTTIFYGLYAPILQADEIAPSSHDFNVEVTMDKASLPGSVIIFDNIFGGRSTPAKVGGSGDVNKNRNNSLTCYSRTDPSNGGACPINPYWGNGSTSGSLFDGKLVLRFNDDKTGKAVDLTLDGTRKRPPLPDVSLWNSVGNSSDQPITFSLRINRPELLKLTPGVWRARLMMYLTRWSKDCSPPAKSQASRGCPGTIFGTWNSTISLKITDYGTQQIYFPEFGASTPLVDLGLRIKKFGDRTAVADANRTIDMCLYDGSNSSSNQISLLFTDEGKQAPGRKTGEFSIYAPGASTDADKRLDYNLSVINPLTGGAQTVKNGEPIIWTGVSADEGKVKTKLVNLPGVNGLVQCVPAPLTFRVPEFKISSKSQGRYSGTLKVVYTPTTQSWRDDVKK